ncbi:hypothetical protein [Undibacterium terreum]|uniref:Uncharacterized protein n=1 Tax=Undibacterium terreum TaxID=1224302 RepID=A0A916V0V4_9BURK|nr:hypothetical protein [Undibacterium terreum]GGD00175.1 hypothetical protein GCM10011396_54610 [Undibacterium terreum]
MIGGLLLSAVPGWVRILGLAAAGGAIYLLGQLHGERVAGEAHTEYVQQQAAQTVKLAKAQQVLVTKTEIEYRDRIKTIYVKGDEIEKQVPVYVTAADNAACTINAGFVRIHDSAWTGEPAGSAVESDREPAGLSLAEVGETEAANAKSCRAWREQALGLRKFYQNLMAISP